MIKLISLYFFSLITLTHTHPRSVNTHTIIGSSAFPGKMLIVRIIENKKMHMLGQVRLIKG